VDIFPKKSTTMLARVTLPDKDSTPRIAHQAQNAKHPYFTREETTRATESILIADTRALASNSRTRSDFSSVFFAIRMDWGVSATAQVYIRIIFHANFFMFYPE
jgi:hypothetical protein